LPRNETKAVDDESVDSVLSGCRFRYAVQHWAQHARDVEDDPDVLAIAIRIMEIKNSREWFAKICTRSLDFGENYQLLHIFAMNGLGIFCAALVDILRHEACR
jgi:hypothetical protein